MAQVCMGGGGGGTASWSYCLSYNNNSLCFMLHSIHSKSFVCINLLNWPCPLYQGGTIDLFHKMRKLRHKLAQAKQKSWDSNPSNLALV